MPACGKTITACVWVALMLLSANSFCAESSPPGKGKNRPPEQDREITSTKKGNEKKATAKAGEAKKEMRTEATSTHIHEPPVGQPGEARTPDIAPIFDQPGVLTPKGTLVLEPSFQFSNSSSNRVALSGYTIIPSFTIGLIDVRNVNSNTYVVSLGARYGITNRVEFEARVPYVYRSDSTSFEPTTDPNTGNRIPASVFTADGNNMGDVEFGPRFQLNQPGGNGPYFIANLRVKSITGKDPFEVPTATNVTSPSGVPLQTELPTGSGFWGIQPGISAIFSSDPAVFFGTVSYMWNMARKVPGQGRMDPGDTIGFNFGIGVALNEKSSFSIGYDHIVLGKPKIDGTEIPGSIITQVGSLLFGFSYKLTEKTSANFSIGAGLTPAASNVQLTLRLPTSFLLTGK